MEMLIAIYRCRSCSKIALHCLNFISLVNEILFSSVVKMFKGKYFLLGLFVKMCDTGI